MNEYKEKIISLGKYTISPIYFKLIFNSFERDILDCLIHFDDIKKEYISNSLIRLYSNLSGSTILRMKKNLIQLNIISVKKETKKGTIYIINWIELYNLLNNLCEESNQIKRLIIADNYREKFNLEGLNKKLIEEYKNTPFDIDFEKDNKKIDTIKKECEITKVETIKLKKIATPEKDLLIVELNINQNKLNDLNLTLSDKNTYQNEINRLRNKAKATNKKITLNRNTEKWEIVR
jgi:uncharacterized membrane protein (Fun14 family)